jgi:hypothetical protein
MARLILKCPYLKGGSKKAAAHLNHLVKYIATREGVEKIPSGRELWHATKNQQSLIQEILREFPDTKELYEYEDYLENPNRENASEFITIALEQHLDKLGDREKYLDYIANRPRVEKFDSHGLFTEGMSLSSSRRSLKKYPPTPETCGRPSFLCGGRTRAGWGTTTPARGKPCFPRRRWSWPSI